MTHPSPSASNPPDLDELVVFGGGSGVGIHTVYGTHGVGLLLWVSRWGIKMQTQS